jgi:alpha-mannosidase
MGQCEEATAPRRRTLHLIGNSHVDPVWLWRWPEGCQAALATFQSVLARMAEYPELVFTCDSVALLAFVEEHDPALFERLRRRVAEGRFELAGGLWVEPDCNLPHGESLARQALYGQRWLLDRFGRAATVGCNLDPFGHPATLPQLLRKAGLDSYLFLRPGPAELRLPVAGAAFWWRAADGSRVLAYRVPHEYQTPATALDEHLRAALAELAAVGADHELACCYGVGNHGGGPTRANLDSIRRLDGAAGFPHLACSSARGFFNRLAATDGERLPLVEGELQPHAVGSYAAHSGIKRHNRRVEHLLLAAEKWSVCAAVLSGGAWRYPAAELTCAWKQLLFNQSHDTLAGTAIPAAYEDARDQLGEAASIAGRALFGAARAISGRVDLPDEPGATPVVVFNPHPWPLRAEIELEVERGSAAWVSDDEGRAVPSQPTRPHAVVPWRERVVFTASLPALGWRTYRLRSFAFSSSLQNRFENDRMSRGGGAAVPWAASPAGAQGGADPYAMEGEHLAVRVDPATGWLASLWDKDLRAELMPAEPGPHAVVLDDPSDTWGHGVRSFSQVAGAFACRAVRLLEQGPVRSVLRIESEYGRSTLVEELLLGRDARHLEVRVTLDWRERHQLLKLRVPAALEAVTATHEIPYGHIVREANGEERPVQAWVDVSGPGLGLALLNDGKSGFDVQGATIGMTVARSPLAAWHDPEPARHGEPHEYLDQGVQRFTYWLLPHGGDWRAAPVALPRRALQLNQPPFALLESAHPGPLRPRGSLAAVRPATVIVTVLKRAEGEGAQGEGAQPHEPAASGAPSGSGGLGLGGDLIVRAYESAGRPAEATIELPLLGRAIQTRFAPGEIKTFRVPLDPTMPVRESDLLELEAPL